jgi:periplasmic protein TonB
MNRLLISSLAAIGLHGLLFIGIFADPETRVPRPLSFRKINISLSSPVVKEDIVSPAQTVDEKQSPPVQKKSATAPLVSPQLKPAEETISALRPIKKKKQIEHTQDKVSPATSVKQVKAVAEEIQETQKQNAPAASIVVQKAVPLYYTNNPPSYPRAARRRGMEGLVEINALVNRQGKVKEQRIYQSSGYTILDRAALKAVKKWRFTPGVKNGKIYEMWVKVPVRFQLITK